MKDRFPSQGDRIKNTIANATSLRVSGLKKVAVKRHLPSGLIRPHSFTLMANRGFFLNRTLGYWIFVFFVSR